MNAIIDAPRRSTLVAGLLALLIATALLLPAATPAEAGSNWREGQCSVAYNFADRSSGYLYAATYLDPYAWPEPCSLAFVWIYNGGTLLASDMASGDDAVASAVLDSAYWSSPGSVHEADHNRDYTYLPYNY